MDELGQPMDDRVRAVDPGASEDARSSFARVRSRLFRSTHPRPDAPIARYQLGECVGRGGGGLVYAGRDRLLDRPVAIKLLSAQRGAGSEAHARFLREAHALAELSHPNVVAIYDVGAFDPADVDFVTASAGVFLVMEHVIGRDLSQWLRERRRPWRDVRRVFLAVAEGLALAHDRGIVHRDVKPANILLGDDGRVRVADFGLARGADPEDGAAAPVTRRPLDVTVTASGDIAGTPAYMAPEQLDGGRVDARTDQYGFAVALAEAASGRCPFTACAFDELRAAKRAAPTLSEWPRDVPRRVKRAIERALSPDPAARFADLRALMHEIDRARPSTVPAIALASSLAAAIGLAIVGPRDAQRCHTKDRDVDAAWNEAARGDLRRGLASAGMPAPAVDRVAMEIDVHVDAWSRAHSQACDAMASESAIADARLACLRGQLERLRVTVETLTAALPTTTPQALALARELDPPSACDAPRDVFVHGPLDAGEIEIRIARALRLRLSGRYEEALADAEAAVVAADPSVPSDLAARALIELATVARERGDFGRAAQEFERAALIAEAVGNDRLAVSATSSLVQVMATHLARYDDARAWARHGEASLERLGTLHVAAGELLAAEATIADQDGRPAEARALYERAIAIYERVPAADLELAGALNGMASASIAEGDAASGGRFIERALELARANLGPRHPRVARLLANSGLALELAGDFEGARERYAEALAIFEDALADQPDHPDIAAAYLSLGAVDETLGDLPAARRELERALPRLRVARSGDHPQVATALQILGHVRYRQGEVVAGRALMEEALAILERVYAPDNVEIARALVNFATVIADGGDDRTASDHYRRAIALFERKSGNGKLLGSALSGLAWIDVRHGRPSAALEPLRRALALHEAAEVEGDVVGATRFRLAVAMWDARFERARAHRMAERALTEAKRGGPRRQPVIDEIEAWLAEHEAPALRPME